MEVKKIYFDMDGVLADFDRGVRELCHIEPQKQGTRDDASDEFMWSKIREIPHYYDQLEIMDGALDMFNMLYSKYGNKVEILTGIPKPRRGVLTAGEDKIAWMKRLFSKDIVVNIVYKEEKKNFCTGHDCILIDDLDENINSWIEFGGVGILHKSSQDTIQKLKDLGVL